MAAAYIKTNLPDCKIGVYDPTMHYTDETIEALNDIQYIDYAINTIFFAEMTEMQFRKYLSFVQKRLRHFYLRKTKNGA